jgi:cupin fold WbuC family metalloprotein
MKALRLLDAGTLTATMATARSSARGRSNFNLHPTLADPVQRFLNVLQPGSYVRPHRHEEFRWELFLLLEGAAVAVVFDEAGNVTEHVELRRDAARAVEVPGGVWHTLFALAPDTVLFEVKPGPYRPLTDKDFAAWAPIERSPESLSLLAEWERLVGRRSA